MIRRNSILIVGNGFDLAHGHSTSYSDFADYYLRQIIGEFYKKPEKGIIKEEYLNLVIKYLPIIGYSNNANLSLLADKIRFGDRDDVHKYLLDNPFLMVDIIKNGFLAKLYTKDFINWFDIESTYFDELNNINIEILTTHKKGKEKNQFLKYKTKEIVLLNSEMNQIKNELKIYLESLKIKNNNSIKDFFISNQFNSRKVFVVNFNYTDTIGLYSEGISVQNERKIFNIHGSLKDKIIFGYGNDNSKAYQTMKDSGVDEFLENFKTFEYMNNEVYSKFFNIELPVFGEYDVYVIGHSLQLTDKTSLGLIFNNAKCKNIHLIKRGDLIEKDKNDAYRKLLFATSRIITSDEELRKKVVNYKSVMNFPS